MITKNFPQARNDELVIQELKDEIIIYDLKIGKAFCLNETSALVWQLCNGNNSVSEISKELSRKLKQPASEDLVWYAIDQLKKDDLLANSEEIEIDYNGLSRREVIRKIGFASMVVLPVVASLVAPAAAAAQSIGNCNTACSFVNLTPCHENPDCFPACFDGQCLPANITCLPSNALGCSPTFAGVGESNCCPGLICTAIAACAGCSTGKVDECGPGTNRPQPCQASFCLSSEYRCCSGIINSIQASPAGDRWECWCGGA